MKTKFWIAEIIKIIKRTRILVHQRGLSNPAKHTQLDQTKQNKNCSLKKKKKKSLIRSKPNQ